MKFSLMWAILHSNRAGLIMLAYHFQRLNFDQFVQPL